MDRAEFFASMSIWRNHQLIQSLASVLELSESDVDALFIAAGGIE